MRRDDAMNPEIQALILAAERVLRADQTAQPYEHSLALLALQRAVMEAKRAEQEASRPPVWPEN